MNARFGSPILSTASQLMVPVVLLFALYVVFHGHYSPGGGFQGGAMIAAAVIQLRLVQGTAVVWGIRKAGADLIGTAGVAVFAGIGMLCLAAGGEYLNYEALEILVELDPPHLRYWGILGVELGVALGVAGVLISISRVLYDAKDVEEEF